MTTATETLVDYWRRTRLLDIFAESKNVSEDDVAILLENQRLYNETVTDVDNDISYHRLLEKFKRMSVPMVARIMCAITTPHLVRMQPIGEISESAHRFVFKTRLTDRGGQNNLDMEAESTAMIAREIATEIDLHVLDDIRSHVGSIAFVDPEMGKLGDRAKELMSAVESRCGHLPNWIVSSTELSGLLIEEAESFDEPDESPALAGLGVRFIGLLTWPDMPKQMLFENTFAPEHEILMGYHSNQENGTYQFSPKLLLEALPTRRERERVRQASLLAQFNKQMPKNGGNFYARMTVKAPD